MPFDDAAIGRELGFLIANVERTEALNDVIILPWQTTGVIVAHVSATDHAVKQTRECR